MNENQTEQNIIDLTPKDENCISIKYEPHLFDKFHFYFSKYFMLKVVPTTVFIFFAIIGFLVMFTAGLPINKSIVWISLGVLFAIYLVIKPLTEFLLIKSKSKEKYSCEFFGDSQKITVKTPINEKTYNYDFLKQIIKTENGMTFKFGQIRHFYLPARIYKDNADFEKYYKFLEKNYIV